MVNAMRGTSGSVGSNTPSFRALLVVLGVVVCCGMAVGVLRFIGKSEAEHAALRNPVIQQKMTQLTAVGSSRPRFPTPNQLGHVFQHQINKSRITMFTKVQSRIFKTAPDARVHDQRGRAHSTGARHEERHHFGIF
jgi:hypothetical protein